MDLNQQPTEKLDLREDGSLDIHSAFDTIQGEGPEFGRPATFIRLAGCNLMCRLCDTDYTSNRERMSVRDILNKLEELPSRNLIVLTGGEPLRQNIVPLCWELMEQGKDVQVETNGTVLGPLDKMRDADQPDIQVVCSPKSPQVNMLLAINWVDCWKYVVQAGQIAQDGLPLTTLGQITPVARPPTSNRAPIFIQPLDEKNEALNIRNTRAAVEVCQKFNYRLSMQLHKGLNLP